MIIAVNLLGVNKEIGGAYNYIDNLLTGLNNQNKLHIIKIFYADSNRELVVKHKNLELIFCKVNSFNRLSRIIYENTFFQYLLYKHKVDLVLWPCDTMGFIKTRPSIVISHDFLPLINPKSYSFFKKFYLKFALRFAIRNADYYFFISRTTQKELKQISPNFDIKKSEIIPNIIDNAFKKLNSDELKYINLDFELPSKYFLYVAHYYPHKNHKKLIKSYAKYRDDSNLRGCDYLKLVLRGDGLQDNDEISQIIVDYNLFNDVIFIPRVSQSELIKVYNLASALVFPSFYEGGGIPVMEAFACGCFIIASEIEAVIEFTGGNFLRFDTNSEESITKSLQEFTINNSILNSLSEESQLIIENHREFSVIKRFFAGISFLQERL